MKQDYPEREFRWHPLLGQWVIYSVSTSRRPWSGARASQCETTAQLQHDPDCYLCPGVTRANGKLNPVYRGAFAFDNDYPSLTGDGGLTDNQPPTGADVLQHASEPAGVCRVMCWNDRHDLTLADLSAGQMLEVAQLWQQEYRTLANRPDIAHVSIFENKGVEIGVSNLHPHGQIYATPFITAAALQMRDNQAAYWNKYQESLLQALLKRVEYSQAAEHGLLVEEGEYFKTIVPWFAQFAYESWIVPKQHTQSIADFDDASLGELAVLYQRQVQRYDSIFERSAPNITLLHNAPCDGHPDNQWSCFHIGFKPPLREPDKLKFLAGFEAGAGNIVNPLTPEVAALRLRECAIR